MTRRMKVRSIVLGLALLGLAGFLVARRGDGEARRGSDPGLLLDRVWVDSKPEKYTDFTHFMLAVSNAPIGIFQKASAYQATSELFEYKRRGDSFAVHFPQSGTKRETKFGIRSCRDLPPFDLCLELGENPWGGPRRYYGLSDPDEERAELGEVRHQLEHRLLPADRRPSTVDRSRFSDGVAP